jgi:hypothetical protein
MALRLGREAETNPRACGRADRRCLALARCAGFLLYAAMGLGLLAAMILLPAYARMLEGRYERDRHAAAVADRQRRIAANERFIRACSLDRVLTRRLIAAQAGRVPANVVIFADPRDRGEPMPAVTLTRRAPRPRPPDGTLVRAAERLENPATRRGLFAVAVACLAVAFLVFAPPHGQGTRRR